MTIANPNTWFKTMESESKPLSSSSSQPRNIGILAGSVAHDLNNLLTVVQSEASLALFKLKDEDNIASSHIQKIIKTVRYAAALSHQLMATSHGEHSPETSLDLNQLIQETVSLLGAAFLHGMNVQFELEPNLPSIEASEGQIQQVIMNLIINASQAVGESEGTISIRTGRQMLLPGLVLGSFVQKQPLPGKYVYFQVHDTGPGIDKLKLSDMFEPFFSTKEAGWGLGLTTVLDIVHTYQGGLAVESQPGRGTTFTIFFPY